MASFSSFFLGREGFWARLGLFRFHGAIKGAAARPESGGEGKGRSGARHCRPQHPGNWQSGTSDHSETGFHTHGWMNKNAGTKEEKKKKIQQLQFLIIGG